MNKLFVFHGVDHKVGTTMLAQSVAEYLSNEYQNLKVLFMTLNGRESAEYVRETPETIEAIKMHIDNKMLSSDDFEKACKKTESFYMLAGIRNELEGRFYYPETVKNLLHTVASEFHIIIIDSGNEIDHGLAIGSLSSTENRFLVISQQESVLRRWERLKSTYGKLGIQFMDYVLNKYHDQDPYGLDYISNRIEISKEQLMKVENASYARQAEMDYRTLLEYRNEKYNQDIERIANKILAKVSLPINKKQRKSKWKSFI